MRARPSAAILGPYQVVVPKEDAVVALMDCAVMTATMMEEAEKRVRRALPDVDQLSSEDFGDLVSETMIGMSSSERARLRQQAKLAPRELIQRIGALMDDQRVRTFLDVAWQAITEEQRQDLTKRAYAEMMRSLNSGKLEPRIRELFVGYIGMHAEEELKRRSEDLRAKVAEELNAQWEKRVEEVVKALVDEAVAKIKAEFTKP